MKLFVCLAVLGVCYASTVEYSCNKGDKWDKDTPVTVEQCTAVATAAEAVCSQPAYMEMLENKYTAYACGACKAADKETCTTCTNGASALTTPCNTQSMPTHAYECPQYEMKGEVYTAKAVKAKCTTTLVETAKVPESENCFMAKAGYKKPSGVNADDAALILGGCGKCDASPIKDTTELLALCENSLSGSAATMSFLLAPLLAVLFWLH